MSALFHLSLLALTLAASTSEVDRLIREGIELRTQGQDQAALERFARAHQLDGSPRALAQMGLVEVALKSWIDAERHLEEVLAKGAGDDWVVANTRPLADALARAKKELASVELSVRVLGARIRVDGAEVGRSPLGKALRLTAGTHQLEIEAEGYKVARRTLTLSGGTVSQESMELQPKPLETAGGGARPDLTPPPETTRVEAERPSAGGPSALFWVTAVSAGVSLAVGIVGVVSAVTSEEKEPGTIVAAVGGGLGIALSVTSIVLLVTGEDPPPPALTPPSSPLELRWGAGHPGGP